MRVVDTNILVHAVNRSSPKHGPAHTALLALAEGATRWALTWTVVYEFLRVVTHPRVLPAPMGTQAAWEFIQTLMSTASCGVLTETGEHARVMQLCLSEAPRVTGNIIHDLHAAVLMREHGIDEILTEDRDFLSFPWVRVVTL